MSYKTILMHVDGSTHDPACIALASVLALQYEAHLIGAALTGVSRFFYQESGADLMRTVLAPYMDELFRKRQAALDRFEGLAAAASVRSYEKRLIDDEAAAGLVLAARYADLVVLGQADPGAPAAPGGALAASVLLACPRPLLVVPYVQGDSATGRRVLVAWNGSSQAMRAVNAALPFLRRADSVTVAMFSTPHEPLAADPDLALYLKRHGVDGEIVHMATDRDVGAALLSLVADQDADLLVMGGYGRTRLRELLLGGVTRSVMEAMTVPALFTH